MKTLADLVKTFRKRGDAVALVHKTDYRTFQYPYHDLFRRACQFANFLARHRIKKGDRILLWGPNSPAWATVFFGAVLAGAVIVPLDIRSRQETIRKIDAQVRAKALFCTRYKQRPLRIKTFILEDLEKTLDSADDKEPSTTVRPSDLVEILYTSGTTGDPKGVMLTHQNIVSNMHAMRRIEPLSSEDKLLSVLPLSHIFEQTAGFLYPLSQGASVCQIHSIKAGAIQDALRRERITTMVIVPRFLEMFKKSMPDQGRHLLPVLAALGGSLPRQARRAAFFFVHRPFGRKFKYFVVGGAPLDPTLERFFESLGFRILQGYGLTETSPIISCNAPDARKTGSVGRIIDDVNVTFADKEIWVKGPNVTQGYYKNPSKNKDSFEKGWFKTGDLGELDADGFLFLHGRKKDMIITSGGINVYPDDIEEVLKRIDGVRDACVVGRKQDGGEEVHAVILQDERRDLRDILRDANEQLDSEQQIQDITAWPFDDFPRTPTMKIKKSEVLEHIESSGEEKKKGPVSVPDMERGLFSILRRLVRDPSSIKSSAALGADLKLGSIDRVELVSLLEQEFNVDIDEARITRMTTVADLETMIHERRRAHRKTFSRWTRSGWCRAMRAAIQQAVIFPIVRAFCSPQEVTGLDHLKSLTSPAVFTANHQSHFDTPLVIMHLPKSHRTRIAPAAWEEYFESKNLIKRAAKIIAYNFVTICFNGYPFPQTRGFRRALQYTGELLDDGWSVLLFPEGTRSPDERMAPFERGVGLIASEMKVQIVPVRISGANEVLPRGVFWPRRGPVSIAFGKPLFFEGGSQAQIVKRIEKAVQELGKNG